MEMTREPSASLTVLPESKRKGQLQQVVWMQPIGSGSPTAVMLAVLTRACSVPSESIEKKAGEWPWKSLKGVFWPW